MRLSLPFSPLSLCLLMARLYDRVGTETVLEAAGVSKHLDAAIAASHRDSRLSTQHCGDIATTPFQGSKPGDPLGDIIFNFAMMSILDEVEKDARDIWILAPLPSPKPGSYAEMIVKRYDPGGDQAMLYDSGRPSGLEVWISTLPTIKQNVFCLCGVSERKASTL